MNAAASNTWPVLRRYTGTQLRRIAMPLGGIGTGTVSLGGRGDLRDWEVVNRPAKGFVPRPAFFALYARPAGGDGVTRLLEGPLDTSLFEGARGSSAPNHNLPRFSACTFETAYPFGQVVMVDPAVPLAVRLQAFNPLIPADADRSGVPVAVLRFQLSNSGDAPVDAAICGSLQNFIGSDGSTGTSKANRNTFQETPEVRGLLLSSDGVDPEAEQWGTLALAVLGGGAVSYRTAWSEGNWGAGLLDFWDDFSTDGALDERPSGGEAPVGSLAARISVPPGETQTITFLLAWHFPNRMTWSPSVPPTPADPLGNYYATQYADAWDVAVRTAADLPALEAETLSFVEAFCGSDLPDVVKEAALFNLSTLRTQTCFRTTDGRMYGWEGCDDRSGCCHGSCTHVWNYEQATAFLFGDLARSMREVEFLHTTRENGHMSFRVNLPLERAQDWGLAAADGQLGCLMKLYREWQLSGDEAWLRRLWPAARRALEFCWLPGGWDADRDGVMEGCQHNTMDVEYYGPNPQMGTWYLGAVRAMEEMARRLGEIAFATECRRLFVSGSAWLDAHLFNGEYYEHEIRPVADPSTILPGLRHEAMGARDPRDPELQLGAGCLVDQLVGQYMACVCGLGDLLDPAHISATLTSLLKYNFKQTMLGQFNPMRSYAMGPEAAMLMATYPRGRRPRRPFPYFAEAMTGFEYTVAVHLLYEGRTADGLRVIQAIRDRYDGEKRSPFDEAECGHHYARAMASWGAVLALTGFHYSADEHLLRFAVAEQPAQYFWSNGYAWGACRQQPESGAIRVDVAVLHGSLTVGQLQLTGFGVTELVDPQMINQGSVGRFLVRRGGVHGT
jgi:non-lysosomal glucosylceramidase